jgi:amino acid adenylation domain-containing protein
MERSPELIATILGVLKAGGAYLPLDSHYPKDRLAFLLNDSEAPVLITEEGLLEQLPEYWGYRVCIDLDRETIAQESPENPDITVASGNLAYVIHTSGSTGRPKGVMVTHENVERLFAATQAWFRFDEHDVWTLFHSYSFDFSVWEIWGALLYGGRLIVVPYLTSRSPDSMFELILGEGVTVLNQTPSAFLQLVHADRDAGDRGARQGLRLVILGGEALDFQSLKPWFDRHGDQPTQVINMYGITETTVFVTYRPLTWSDVDGDSSSRIGIPIPDLHTHVLDGHWGLTPIGVPGELFVGGAGLSRGYLGRPDLTAERFIPDPFSGRMGGRLYKTGDLARWLPEGDLEYRGRIDHQVKIRGFRIELGEIESVLRLHPAVSDAAILVRDGEEGERHLVGYVAPNLDEIHLRFDPAGDRSSAEQVSQWQALFDDVYKQGSGTADPEFNISGWNSSYTGTPISAEEMQAWLGSTVERILALRPQRVLEIGCGTGLLLFRIAPHCTEYWGTDLAIEALNQVEQQVRHRSLTQVRLLHRPADDFEAIPPGSFDGIILNSVVQYFPGVEYLVRVLAGALKAVAPGGFIFLGDLRNLPLLEVFHASLALHQAPGSLSIGQLRQQVQNRLQQEDELVIDPALFSLLQEQLPQISHVRVLLKRGEQHNELTKFRYDVILHVSDEMPRKECARLDWEQTGLSVEAVQRLLRDSSPEALIVEGVPNARLQSDAGALELLRGLDAPRSIEELREQLQDGGPHGAVDPEALWGLSRELPYSIDVSPARSDPARFEVLFRRSTNFVAVTGRSASRAPETERSWNAYANAPLKMKLVSRLVPELRSFLQERLPDYMVPSRIVVLDALPLTQNGKVDRKALPAPDDSRPELAARYVTPRTPVEELLASLWAEALQVQKVGALDNFFELGGQSLIAVQVISRIRERFGIDLPLQSLLSSSTLADLASEIAAKQAEQLQGDGLTSLLEEIEALSETEAQAIFEAELGKKEGGNG